ncbi:MAG: ABC transporter ATP-binding protein [Bacillota bacterium]|nr:ABC transporter ATP-binding protein [Bacillota bacterium]
MNNILEIKGLAKNFKSFALHDVSFSLPRGYIMGFIGPNGSGKTTTLKMIMNLMRKDAGFIEVFGQDHVKFEREIKQRIGFVYDEPVYYEQLNLKQMTSLISPFYKKWNQSLYEDYIKRFNLNSTQKIKTLSKGMRTKYALSLALSHGAELLIMDEPTAGLDPVFRRELLDILMDVIQREENSILFSTHITSDLDRIADYITFINEGRIVLSEEKDRLYERYTLVKGGKDDLSEALKKELVGMSVTGLGFEGLSDHPIQGENLVIEKPSLEDIMFFHTKEQRHGD